MGNMKDVMAITDIGELRGEIAIARGISFSLAERVRGLEEKNERFLELAAQAHDLIGDVIFNEYGVTVPQFLDEHNLEEYLDTWKNLARAGDLYRELTKEDIHP